MENMSDNDIHFARLPPCVQKSLAVDWHNYIDPDKYRTKLEDDILKIKEKLLTVTSSKKRRGLEKKLDSKFKLYDQFIREAKEDVEEITKEGIEYINLRDVQEDSDGKRLHVDQLIE
jgi:hypothetical protein